MHQSTRVLEQQVFSNENHLHLPGIDYDREMKDVDVLEGISEINGSETWK